MKRTRSIAAAPMRTTGETWAAITQLVADTLSRSDKIEHTTVAQALTAAKPAGHLLVAGGHLDHAPLIVRAADVELEVVTVSGDAAVRLEENLNPVPGASDAADWVVYFPTPEPVGGQVRDCIKRIANLTCDSPKAAATTGGDVTVPLIDREAFLNR